MNRVPACHGVAIRHASGLMMRPRRDRSLLNRLGNGLLLCAMAQWCGPSIAGTQLPVPCVATSCGSAVKGFVTTGSASAVQSGKTLSVSQTSNTATLNWSSFNISADGKVVFVQPASTSIALNRIFDTNPSSIFGTLSANGQIYLINANGFLFGSGATVNVGGLLASSLNLTDATFASGLLVPGQTGQSALQSFVDASGNVLSQGITVQPGAQLTAADGGRLLLAAPNVTNGGSLSAPDGQIILAAGQSLYLQASGQSDLRGLVVEVDNGGTAANQLSGKIAAPRGNITLTGLMVNQDGRVSATTSVNANGSIVLQAADTFPTGYTEDSPFSATRGGTVELGPGSLTEVLPEYADPTTAVAAQTQLPSGVVISGEQVLMHGATINAPSGALTVTAGGSDYTVPLAQSNPTNPPPGIQPIVDPDAQIRIDSGTTINLSGSDAALPMAANLVSVQLRSNELADDPTQRGGALQSTPNNVVTVTVDVRADGGKGTPIADVTSAIAAVGQTIAQRTEAGGTAQFDSNGDVVFSPGASINVSDGYTTYLGGSIQTTKLIGANGQLYDIGSANPLLTYTGVVNPTFTQSYDKWGIQEVIPTPGLSQYESTYVQGAAAGSVQFAAPSLALGGNLRATATSGPYQRGAPPAGGTLIIGEPLSTPSYYDYLAPSVSFVGTPTPIVVADGAPLPAEALQLPTSYLTSNGFTTATIYSNTSIALPAGLPLSLPPGASLSLVAPRIDVDSSITAVAGTLFFENVPSTLVPVPTGAASTNTQRLGIGIGDGVTLDVSGQWTNDSMVTDGIGAAPTFQNAGSIDLKLTTQQSELVLGDYVSLKANGGAWLESGGTLAYGAGGSITLDASPAQGALQFGEGLAVQGFGTGTASGGSFSLLAPRLEISQGTGSAWTEAQRVDDLTSTTGPVLNLYAPLFSDYGFSAVNLTATGAVESYATTDVLTVASGTTITAQTSTLQLNPNYVAEPTGTSVSGFTQVNVLPIYERPNTDVSLSVLRLADDQVLGSTNYGTLDIPAGASILAGPGATIALNGEGGVTVGGTLRAPGGKIAIAIPSPTEVDPSDASGLTDPGYQPSLGIDLKPTAILDASGTVVMTPNSQGLLTGTVLPGGTVTLTADRGIALAEPGSAIDIQGTSATLDVANSSLVAGYTREAVASAGGSVTVSSPDSISLLGTLKAQAGVGSGGSAAAGSLEVDLVRGSGSTILAGPSLPQSTLEIELVNSTAGSAPSPSSSNLAVLGAEQIAASGIDSLTLRAGGVATAPYSGDIEFDAGRLSLARQLILDAPSFTVQASESLTAPYIDIGNSVANSGSTSVVPTTPTSGSGKLTISAQQVNVLGSFAVQGAAAVTFASAGDVQLEGTTSTNTAGPNTGSIVTSGSLAIDALRVYPDTYTDFTITSLKGSGGTVSIGSTGASPGTPLSAGGSVTLSADRVLVTGTLLAPFGTINLSANNSVTLAGGSLVSVSGAGLDIPYGETELNQGEWIYTSQSGYINPITGVPAKQISVSAPTISVQSGATANISGGGDLYAYEWVPGTGGTYDNLNAECCATASNTAFRSIPNLYAILPAARGQAGPYDPEESSQSTPGQTIYLGGGAGVAAGYYALLPPRYALATGAVLIQLEPSVVSASVGQIGALANGTPVIAGYLSTGTTGLHTSGATAAGVTEYEGVAVYPSGYAEELAAYTVSDASSYFSKIAQLAGTGTVALPADAGTFSLSVTPAAINALDLQGSVLTSAASGGRGAQINLNAPDLVITAGDGAAGAGSITVSANVLQSWNAGSLSLGGAATSLAPTNVSTATSSTTTDNTSIAVEANTVTVQSGAQLTADQIELVAQQSIDVQAGASLQSTSGRRGAPLSSLPSVSNVILTDTAAAPNALFQAALLSVSDLTLPVVCRSSTCLPSTINAPSAAATLPPAATIAVQAGATLSSGGSLAVDAPGKVNLAGTFDGKGASWSLSSDSIAFSGSAPTGTSTDTLNIGSGLLAALQQAGAVRLSSQGSIDIDAPVSLGVGSTGTPTLSALTLVGNSISNQSGGNAVFGGARLDLGGNLGPDPANPPAPAPAGSGNLSFIANTLAVGPGVLAVNGFGQTTAQVASALETNGAGYLNIGGNLSINAAELTPAPIATDATAQPGVTTAPGTTLAATGTLHLGAPTAVGAGTLPTLVGGSLTMTASDIEDAGVIVAPSGVVSLASSGNLHLSSTARIDTAGTMLPVVTQSAASPGGLVMLSAGANLSLDAGSRVSVAGSATAPAGSLTAAGSGTVAVAGTIDGAAAGNTGGSLSIDAGTLAGGLGSLTANPGLAGFSAAVNVRAHTGNLDLSTSGAITANSITLSADSGAIDVAGVLSAPSAAQRGLIDLSGGVGVTLGSTGQLHADGSGSSGRGGEIELNSVTASCNDGACTSTGSISLDSGSVITAHGTAQMGELVLRAPALIGSNDVAINGGSSGLGANVSQAGQVIIEPVLVSATASGTVNADLANAVSNATAFLSAASRTISGRLTSEGATPIAVQAGVELQDANANDALTVQSIDLSQNSTLGQVVNVALLAAGGITLDGTISDGFLTSTPTGTALTNLPSGSLTFVAGADLSSANPRSVLPGSTAALVLGPQAVLRTGTGDINLAAAGAIDFQYGAGSAAAVYTGGLAGTGPISATSITGQENFPTEGGTIRIVAGGDVIGAPLSAADPSPDNGNYSVTGWLLRGATVAASTTNSPGTSSSVSANYGIDFDDFDWNVGALGGGDVTVAAGGKISNLSAATADSSPDGNATLYGAGGGMRISARGDIGSAQLYVADGQGTVTTMAGLTPIMLDANGQAAGSSVALGDAQVSVWARQSVQVDALYNPTFTPVAVHPTSLPPSFFTYGADSALNLSSTDGSVTLSDAPVGGPLGALVGTRLAIAPGFDAFLALPPDLSVQALQQDIDLSNNTIAMLFPSSTGQLRLVAGRDIAAVQSGSSVSEYGISMSDSAAVPTPENTDVALATGGTIAPAGLVAFQGVIHVGDSQPAIVAAGRDIDDLAFSVPKAADISAGRDIVNLVYQGQNIAPSDTTLITAGRDIEYTTAPRLGISVGGEGSLDIFAGRNVSLGVSPGILTTGDLANADLPSAEGANLTLAVGYGDAGADYASFLTDIIAPSSTYQGELVSYVESQTGATGLTYSPAQTAFGKFTIGEQAALIDNVFFNELLLSGRAANSGTGVGFSEGYAAIDALYPGSRNPTASNPNPYSGNLDLISSQIYTLSGGNISILVPGGSIDVGLAFTPVGIAQKGAGQLGIVAEGPGNIDIYSQGDVNVNASRIFTLGGGNILIWSDEGSIDAGNGSKSSLSVPPPTVLVNSDGSVSIDYSGSLSGSGIRTIQTDPSVPAGNVDLDAPVGTVNAGDAGIGAAGNINIAAAHVIGALNINFGGTATGVPSDLSGLAASLSGVSAVGSGAQNANTNNLQDSNNPTKETAPLAQTELSWLEVFVTGLGEENCKQDDVECLKRQKSAVH
jgi:filamentous hemagglutinin family protein